MTRNPFPTVDDVSAARERWHRALRRAARMSTDERAADELAALDGLSLRCACGHLAYDHAQSGCYAVAAGVLCECRTSHAALVGDGRGRQ